MKLIRQLREVSLANVIFAFLTLVFLAIGVAVAVSGLTVRQAMAEGEQGTFAPQVQTCKQVRHEDEDRVWYEERCSWAGRFEGAQTTIDSIRIDNSFGTERRDDVPAPVDAVLGSDGKVYPDHVNSWRVRVIIGGGFVAFGLVFGAITLVLVRTSRREKANRASAPAKYTL